MTIWNVNFPKDKIVKTGNPVRQDLFAVVPKEPKAYAYFGLEPDKKTILIVGGSLGGTHHPIRV